MKLRIKFRKYGPVRYIGHLDLMRFFQKAIRRAQIDVAYSGGFSPHQIMAFAAPLGVGLTSNGEYIDIEVNSMENTSSMERTLENFSSISVESSSSMESHSSIMSCQNIMERLNKASVPGIEIVSVKRLPDTAGNAMASVAAAAYTVYFREGREPKINIGAILPDFLAREQILITKKTKKGVREVDLKQGIYQLYMKSDNSIYMLVDASSGGNIKPMQVIDAILDWKGEVLQENALFVIREDMYTNIGNETTPKLISLDAIGNEEIAI